MVARIYLNSKINIIAHPFQVSLFDQSAAKIRIYKFKTNYGNYEQEIIYQRAIICLAN